MNSHIENLSLIDLISEKHKKLRIELLKLYDDEGLPKLGEMGYYLISILNRNRNTISESARIMNISRQAVHKYSKVLIELKLITIESDTGNKRDKYMVLTEMGKDLFCKTEALKLELEHIFHESIGVEGCESLKKLFMQRWI